MVTVGGMKFYSDKNVFDAALERINWVFDEFPNVVVGFSGGKDSTVIFNLTLRVATERGRLPLRVLWLDQEAEWQFTADFARLIMTRDDVEPWHMQMPIKISNATSATDNWLYCWQEGEEWMRDKEPYAKTVNRYGTDRFHELFNAVLKTEWGDQPTALIGGVRTEESPTRFLSMTRQATYKHVTWGKKLNPDISHYTFYPIYDWGLTDVWHAIESNGWDYCKLYDYQYQHGYAPKDMRLSNLHHETAISHLWVMQEIEPQTWSKLTKRLAGINTTGHLQKDSHRVPKVLPFMFKTWRAYRDHLLENLITDAIMRAKMRHQFDLYDKKYATMKDLKSLRVAQIATILAADWEFVKLHNWRANPMVQAWHRNVLKGKPLPRDHENILIGGRKKPRGPRDQPG